jgi:hypothetical protein
MFNHASNAKEMDSHMIREIPIINLRMKCVIFALHVPDAKVWDLFLGMFSLAF